MRLRDAGPENRPRSSISRSEPGKMRSRKISLRIAAKSGSGHLFWSPFRQCARDNARNYEIAFAKLGSFSGSKPGFELACVTQLSEANASAC